MGVFLSIIIGIERGYDDQRNMTFRQWGNLISMERINKGQGDEPGITVLTDENETYVPSLS